MQILKINKTLYRKRLNIFIAIFVSSFALLAVAYGAILIELFSDGQGDNFKLNFTGVILALITCTILINFIKQHHLFTEIYYVWQLKQLHNRIYRSLNKIKTAAAANDIAALTILLFYYQTLKQVYQLDDNVLTINKVNEDFTKIEEQISALNLSITVEDFNLALFEQIK